MMEWVGWALFVSIVVLWGAFGAAAGNDEIKAKRPRPSGRWEHTGEFGERTWVSHGQS